jgi:transposase InsO family protein
LAKKIKAAHIASRGLYGSPKIYRELRREGAAVNHKRVSRLIKEHGLKAKRVKKSRRTTDSRHSLPVAENVLARNFKAARPDEVWTSDITYVWTDEGWLYLVVFLDLFSRLVVAGQFPPALRLSSSKRPSSKGSADEAEPLRRLYIVIAAVNTRVRRSENAFRRGVASRA